MTTVNINFADASVSNDPAWNDVNSDPTATGQVVADLNDDGGSATGLSLEITAVFSGQSGWAGGAGTSGDPHGWINAVWDDYWYTNTTATLKISGFAASQTGTIDLAGHPAQAARDTDYTVTGDTVTRYDASGDGPNPTAPVQLNFTANASGEVFIDVDVVSSFAYISGAVLNYTAGSNPEITNVDTDNTILDGQGALEINGTDLGNIDGVNLRDSTGTYVQAQTIDTATATKVTLSGALVRGAVPFSSTAHTIEIEILDGGVSQDTHVVTFNPASGFNMVESASDTGTTTSLSSMFPDETVADNDQWLVPTTTRGGATLTVNPDGTWETGPGSPDPDYFDDVDLWTAAQPGWSGAKDITVADDPAFDTFSAEGTVSSGAVEGDLAATDATDSASFSGDVVVSGDLAVTEGFVDSASFSGATAIEGDLDATDALDSASFSGEVTVQGDLAATDTIDAASSAGQVIVQGDLAATESVADSFSADADIITFGDLDATEGFSDSATIEGAQPRSGDLDATDAIDVTSISGAVTVQGDLAVTDPVDSFRAKESAPPRTSGVDYVAPEGAPVHDVQALAAYVDDQLYKVGATFQGRTMVTLSPLYQEPLKLKDGMVVLADGSNWDPGSGEGYYGYYDGSWHKLG